ncbi:MAG: M20/M25/M40 family metallo-hydrolase [Bradymonadaceae bacterium]
MDDWATIEDEAIDLFKGLLQIDTTNPPGNEREAAEYLAGALREDGLEPWMGGRSDERPNLVARLPATVETDDEAGPVLLAGHTDVVPADEAQWSHPPFGAVEADGCIWGRGAVDMKNMVAMSAMTVKLLAREQVPRRRDLIFAAVADEERGCEYGSKFLVDEHPERVDAEVMLGEVGGFWQHIGEETYLPVMIAEKGQVHLRMTATGPSGHGSIPRRDTAVGALARAVDRLTRERLPYHLTRPVERFIDALARTQDFGSGIGLKGLKNGAIAGTVLDRLLPDPAVARNFDALLHNTVSPTILQGGEQVNVIPGEVSCELDGRVLPGFDADDLVREVEVLVDDPAIDIQVVSEQQAVEHDSVDGEVFEAIERIVGDHAEEAIPVPYMIPGYTDAQHFSRLGTTCYGFSPVKIPEQADLEFSELFHGVDERIPTDGFKWGLRVLYEAVGQLVRPRP